MARSSSIRVQKNSRILRIFPASWQDYLQSRFHDLRAILISLVGGFLLLSLLTYHAADPSLNTVSSRNTLHNWMGLSGSYAADLLVQVFGVGALVLALGFLAWGWRLWKKEDFGPLWARMVALLAASLLIGIAGGAISGGSWISHATMGGAGGVLLLNKITGAVDGLITFYPHIIVASICGLTGLLLAGIGMALRRSERQAVVETFLSSGAATLDGASSLWTRFQLWRAPREEEYDEEEEEEEGDEEYPDEDDESEEEYDEEEIAVVRPQKPTQKPQKAKPSKQAKLNLRDPSEWDLPPVDMLDEVPTQQKDDRLDETALRRNAELLQNVLNDYNVKGEIKSIYPGPVVTLYELEPAPGTKNSRVVSLSDDIARSMSAVSVRVAVVPGRNVIGIELPNKRRQTVYLRELLEDGEFEKTQIKLPLVLGKDIGGIPIIADLSRMPHLLVAGTTGSGKSVAVNTMILSLLYRLPPEKCRFIMIDPKMLELSVYDDIPHLLSPVVTDPGRAVVALKWAVQEMENRYRNMSKLGVRNIEGYNARIREAVKKGEILMRKVQTGFDPETGKPIYEEQPLDLTELPYIVIVVDEFADLMLVAGKDVENAIQRLAQMARAAGLHLIMATQRPSVDVITGVIKANFPTRISFQVTSKIDSRTILGEGGAEALLGMGDMLYMAAGGRITRVHGPFVSDREVEEVVTFLKAQGEPSYLEDVTEGELFGDGSGAADEGGNSCDELYDQAVALVAREGKASTSFIQRHLQIGYNRAARIIEFMEKEGVVSPANRVGKREVLVGNR
ncbi:MAG: DNA translocase FtsK 4TM domain-containing protein [Alphaproteobacteria bacterium]|nr:DNA translocase FtsK 4TM domain-containing protein [Alphaproteobacteria bacterium]MCB9985779.1 DNA translocase FtsK 4TM domain-containing protein [Micavibrio sp.]HPQ50302.1 DNA translocase FtsK 4TM domain-containing protein [Alphaproteobacteria bacterium]